MQRPLDIVTELQSALLELSQREELLNGIPDWMQELHDEHSARLETISGIETELEEASGERRGAEAEIADHQEKLKNFQEQIGRVRNQKEYGALLQEIDVAKNHIRDAEERAIVALEKQEESQGTLDAEREASKDVDGRYAEALEKWEEEKPGVAREADDLRARVQELEAQLTPDVLTTFRRIAERHGGSALAVVRRVSRAGKGPQMWHCGVCNYRVRPQAVVEIADHGNIVLCDSCKRILILDQETA